ncbi:MAG: translocation/assembly module TamB domain-containing protein, partial [Stellaceae bacterium]
LGLDGAVLDLDGTITPALDLNLTLRNFKPALLQPFMPALDADGMATITARLGGRLDAPTGSIHVAASGLRWRSGSARGLAAASLDARATLRGTSAALEARLAAGKNLDLRLSGTVPLQSAGQFDLHAGGALDLVLLDPLLTPAGRNVRGRVTLDLGLGGSFAAPNLSGSATLAKGAVHDFVQGVHITDLGGTIRAEGPVLRIAKLEGRAGSGRLTIAGTVAPLSPGMPVDLTIAAANARLIASDLLTATASGAIKLEGHATSQLQLAGQIKVQRADINLPESLPQQVAVLNVQRPGQQPQAPAPPLLVMTLGLDIEAPEQVFVRGRGVDAEFSGGLQIAGTSAAPQISGGFKLRRGTFSLAGHTLTFTRGTVTFDGSAPGGRLDPALDLAADATANGVTATLTVTGYADAPKIGLSSAPPLPQDEILSQLFFGQSVKQLSPLQLAEIAQALASLGGVGGPNPLSTLRNALGLDRLAVSGASGNTTGTTVEAGKYIASGVYVGAKQGVTGGTQGQVQIDLTKNLKLQTTLASGGGEPVTGATPDNDPGSSIGLTYQFEY